MAGRTDEITEEVKAMARTRAEISEKVEALEFGIRSTVEETKEGVQQVVQHARDTAVDFAQETQQTLDPVYQVRKHAWIIGGAVVLFYILGRLDRRRTTLSAPSIPWQQVGAEVKDLSGQVQKRLAAAQQDIFNQVIPEVQDEFIQVRERFLAIAKTFLAKMARQALRSVAEPLEAALSKERPISSRR